MQVLFILLLGVRCADPTSTTDSPSTTAPSSSKEAVSVTGEITTSATSDTSTASSPTSKSSSQSTQTSTQKGDKLNSSDAQLIGPQFIISSIFRLNLQQLRSNQQGSHDEV